MTAKAKPHGSLQIAQVAIGRLVPYARNARTHDESQIAQIAASITEYGFTNPVLIDAKGGIIAGHGRVLAAQALGLAQVPCIVLAHLSAAQRRSYVLADNKLALNAGWDEELLRIELGELRDAGADLELTGFSAAELAALLDANPGQGDPDEVPPVPPVPVSRTGDLWLLGKHRLMCGDSTCGADVERLMNGERASLMFTDPPYLVDYDGGNHPQSYNTKGQKREAGATNKHWDAYKDPAQASAFFEGFLRVAFERALTPDAAVYQCFASMRTDLVMAAWRDAGLLPHQILVWRKSRPVLTRCWFMFDYEPIMVGWMKGNQPKAKPPNNERAVWEIGVTEGVEDGVAGTHPTIKPVELVRRPIPWHTIGGGAHVRAV
jgi:hypothetical protein